MRGELSVIIQFSFAFFLIFSAFNSHGFVEITILRDIAEKSPVFGIDKNSGYYSFAIIYFFFTLGNFLVPPIVRVIGAKWCMVLGASMYTIFLLGFLCLNGPLLYALSAVLGMGAALIWTGNGVYIIVNSSAGRLARNSGIMWVLLQMSMIAGAFFLYYILHNSDLVSSYRLIYTVFAVLAAAGATLLLLLPAKAEKEEVFTTPEPEPVLGFDSSLGEPTDVVILNDDPIMLEENSFLDDFLSTFSMMKSAQMMRLSVCFFYSGVELTFFAAIYSTCLAASRQLNGGSQLIVAYNAFAMGVGQLIGGSVFGVFLTRLPFRLQRPQVIVFAFATHMLAFYLCFLNTPDASPLRATDELAYIQPRMSIAIFVGFLLGLADGGWNTQIYTLIGDEWPDNSPSALALFKFFQSFGACISSLYGSMLTLQWQLFLLVLNGFTSAVCFIVADLSVPLKENGEEDRSGLFANADPSL